MSYDTITQTFSGQAAVEIACWCSIRFAVPRTLYEYYSRKNEITPGSYALHCPLGHSLVPAGQTPAQREAQRLRDELAMQKHNAEQAQADAEYQRQQAKLLGRQVAAKKGMLTKIKNRVGNGVCPCCNRYFANLHRHMVGQHPDWSPESDAATSGGTFAVDSIIGTKSDWSKLARFRRELGIDLSTAASAIGLATSSLRSYEAGSNSSTAAALRYASYLNSVASAHRRETPP